LERIGEALGQQVRFKETHKCKQTLRFRGITDKVFYASAGKYPGYPEDEWVWGLKGKVLIGTNSSWEVRVEITLEAECISSRAK
jgi:hypothetical protein